MHFEFTPDKLCGVLFPLVRGPCIPLTSVSLPVSLGFQLRAVPGKEKIFLELVGVGAESEAW